MTMGEAAIKLMRDKPNDYPRIAWGDLDAFHEIRTMCGLPQIGPSTQAAVLHSLNRYSQKPNNDLVRIGFDQSTHGAHFTIRGREYVIQGEKRIAAK